MRRYVLIGNFGVGNLGDEALKEYFLTAYPEVSWQVISAVPGPGELPRLPAGIRSLFAFRWLRTVLAMRASDGIVFGGGTLFTDIESVRACFLWWVHAAASRLLGRPRYFAFQGFGPFRSRVGEWLCRSALTGAAHISVRDPASAIRASSFMKNTKIIQSFDPVFDLIKNKKINSRTQKILGIIPRNNSGASLRNASLEMYNKKSFDNVVILLLEPDSRAEREYGSALAHAMGAEVVAVRTVDALSVQVGRCSKILTQRYHGAVAALALGVPFQVVRQKEGDKLSSLGEMGAAAYADLVNNGFSSLRVALGL